MPDLVARLELFDHLPYPGAITTLNSDLDFATGLLTTRELDPPITGPQVGIAAGRTNSNSSGGGGFNLGPRPRGQVNAKMLTNRNNPAFTTTTNGRWPISLLELSIANVTVGEFRYVSDGTTVSIEFNHPDPANIANTLHETALEVPVGNHQWITLTVEFTTPTEVRGYISQVVDGAFTVPWSGTFPFPAAAFLAAEAEFPDGFCQFNVWLDITGFTGSDADCAWIQWAPSEGEPLRFVPVQRLYPREDGRGSSPTPQVFPPPKGRAGTNRVTGYL